MLTAVFRRRQTAFALRIDMHLPPRPLRRIVENSPPHPPTSRPERTRHDHPNRSEQCANTGRLRGRGSLGKKNGKGKLLTSSPKAAPRFPHSAEKKKQKTEHKK